MVLAGGDKLRYDLFTRSRFDASGRSARKEAKRRPRVGAVSTPPDHQTCSGLASILLTRQRDAAWRWGGDAFGGGAGGGGGRKKELAFPD